MSSLEITIRDGNLVQDCYVRNNRNDGLKNLQCFPYCAGLHRGRQFCGHSIHATVKLKPNSKILPEHITVVGQFTVVVDAAKEDRSMLSRRQFEADKRTAHHLSGRYCEGELCYKHCGIDPDGASTFCFELNRKHFGWSYDWISNKHRAADKHMFLVSAYLTPRSEWQCAELLVSEVLSCALVTCALGDCNSLWLHGIRRWVQGEGATSPFIVRSARRRHTTLLPLVPEINDISCLTNGNEEVAEGFDDIGFGDAGSYRQTAQPRPDSTDREQDSLDSQTMEESTCTTPLDSICRCQKQAHLSKCGAKTKKPPKCPPSTEKQLRKIAQVKPLRASDKKESTPLFRRSRAPCVPTAVFTDRNKIIFRQSKNPSSYGASEVIPDMSKEDIMATRRRVERYKESLQHSPNYEPRNIEDTCLWSSGDTETPLSILSAEGAPPTDVFTQEVLSSRMLPLAQRLQQLHVGPAPVTALHRPDANRLADFDTLFGIGGGAAQHRRKESTAAPWQIHPAPVMAVPLAEQVGPGGGTASCDASGNYGDMLALKSHPFSYGDGTSSEGEEGNDFVATAVNGYGANDGAELDGSFHVRSVA